MDNFNNIFDRLSVKLKNTCLLEETSNLFASLETNYERVKFCLSILEDVKLLPSLSSISKKSCTESEKYRNEGNRAFRKRDDIKALEYYSLSVAFAPEGSEEISLAYANRSAVSFSLKQYDDCIIDIERALAERYPKHLIYKLYERKGKCLLFRKRIQCAEECFNIALNLVRDSNLSECKLSTFVDALNKELSEIKSKISESNGLQDCDIVLNNCHSVSNDTTDGSPHKIPNLSYPPNETIVGACDAIAIDYSDEMGRHIIATKDILPGDVLVIEKPYASVLLPVSYNLYCFNCLKRCHTLLPCVNCTKMLYCSEICRDKCITNIRSVECHILDHLIQLGCTKMELLAVRTLLVASNDNKLESLRCFVNEIDDNYYNVLCDERLKGFDENKKYRSDNYSSVHWLATNTELRTNADLFKRSCFAACILHAIDSLTNYFIDNMSSTDSNIRNVEIDSGNFKKYLENKCFAGSLLLKYLQIMPCNAHEVSEMCLIKDLKHTMNESSGDACDESVITYDSREIGGALYPLLSLINHSCDPNVVRHSHQGDTVVLTAIQFIPKGFQILDNYGYHHAVHDYQTRQNYLLSQYHFTCECVACIQDWPHYHMLPDENIIYKSIKFKEEVEESTKEFRNILQQVLKGKYDYDYLNKMTKHLLLLQTAVERPWKEFSECQEAIKQTLSMFANHYVYINPSTS